MKIYIVSENNRIASVLQKINNVDVEEGNTINENIDAEIIVISEKIISYERLQAVVAGNKKMNSKNKNIFFIYSYDYDKNTLNNMETICHINSIKLISGQCAEEEIVKVILKERFSEANELANVITFFGADNKVGTTMMSHSVAETLSANTDLSVALLCLNNNPSREYLKSDLDTGVDQIKIKLFNDVLEEDELVHACIKEAKGLYILPGVNYSPDVKLFHPEHVKRLIKMASNKFDLVVIDAGGNIDSGLAIASIQLAKIRYLVVTQQEAVRKNYKRMESQVLNNLGIDIKQFMLVVNKYIRSEFTYNSQQLSNLYGAILATVIPHADFYGWKAEIEQKTLLYYGLKNYNNQVDYLCKIISLQLKLPYRAETREGLIRRKINSLGGM